MQSHDQTVATTDRPSMGRNRSGDPVRPSLTAPAARLKRKRKHDLRQIVNSILWLLRTGCQWRNLPDCWPRWQAVFYYFDVWKRAGTFERINATLNELDRKRAGKLPTPSLVCIDSQSRSADAVKLSPLIHEDRGLDPNKRVNGRKRHRAAGAVHCRYPGASLDSSCSFGQSSRWPCWLRTNRRCVMAAGGAAGKGVGRSGLQPPRRTVGCSLMS